MVDGAHDIPELVNTAKRRRRREQRLRERKAAATTGTARGGAGLEHVHVDGEVCETCGMPAPGSSPPCPTCGDPMRDLFLKVVGVSDGDDWSEERPVWWCAACEVPRSVFTLEVIEDPTRDVQDAMYWAIVDDRWCEVYRSDK